MLSQKSVKCTHSATKVKGLSVCSLNDSTLRSSQGARRGVVREPGDVVKPCNPGQGGFRV